jgi:DNA mismatch endonuclease (patch repair protein)
VFVDGCFWHRCPMHGALPKSNRDWREAKLSVNVARDRDTDRVLTIDGWKVVRVWEHEDSVIAAKALAQVVRSRR